MAKVSDYINKIKNAVYGKEVRGSIANGIDAINKEVESTTQKQEHLETTFDDLVINAGESNAEIVDARVDKNSNTSYKKLGDRLDNVSSQILKLPSKQYVDKITNSIASGSPKNVFSTVSELESNATANTTDGKKSIYLILEDANWYYWNGSAWTQGGVYQSMGIADNSVTPNMLENGIESLNLYQYPNMCIEDKYIDMTGDIFNTLQTAYAKVPVKPLTTYSFWRESGQYQTGKGWTVFMNEAGEIVHKFDASLYIAGTYNGAEYVTIETPSECKYLCFNVRLFDFDNRKQAIVVEGEDIEVALGIKKIFDFHLVDTLLRKTFNSFLDTFISTSNNIYNFEKNYISDKYVNIEGIIEYASGWGLARIPVNSDTTYSIYMPEGNYSGDIGSLAFYADTTLISFVKPASSLINGKYNEIDYITFKTPIGCSLVYITCKRGSNTRPFDNSKSLLCCESNVINDNLVNNYLTQINGYNIKICSGYIHPLKDKKWVCVGDSLTEKNIRATKNYHDYIVEQTGIKVINMGVGGTGYKRQEENSNAFYQRVKNIPLDADIITIFGSGNDLGLISKLGEVTDTTTDTICGCINKTIDEIYKIKTDAKIGIITPCPWGNYNPVNKGNSMDLYSQKLVEICKLRGIPCLDLYHSSNMRPWDIIFKENFYKRDAGNSVHPDEDGHKFMFNRFLKFIESL